ncbi:hypothetical protein KEM63_10805 [Halopseudomonas nanhaiensis]|uniref:hypothetical protein n=1 Tax=Halopseudomonas nanhaiensis TaxID=2830842 RepID=UPI001CC1A19C|nr:hypothetical protein [Halopseudomonas nanhaiensis]UAW97313.1 hypothetical protein KEM63_10805 [Halopseudomonas nanhaiensis]
MQAMIDLSRPGTRALLVVLVLLCAGLSWLGLLDARCAEYVDGSLLQAGLAFATARGLNALISVMQSTTLSFSLFAGVQVTLGELLDPFNDLVEQYSSMMKLAIGSLVIQKVLLDIVSDTLFKVLLSLSALALVGSVMLRSALWTHWLLRVFALLLFLRFALVLAVALNGLVDRVYIADQTRAELAVLGSVSTEIELIDQPVSGGGSGADTSLRSKMSRLGDPQTYREMQQQLEDLSMNVVTVMALFFLRTLILPLLFLFLLSRAARLIWRLEVVALPQSRTRLTASTQP